MTRVTVRGKLGTICRIRTMTNGLRESAPTVAMGSRRTAKVAEAIREVVSSTILFELRDPRVQQVTVLGVDVPQDLRTAKVRVSVMGDEPQQRLTLRGLNAAKGFIQGKVGDRLNLRFTPILSFEIDDGVKKSIEAARILRELAEERATEEPSQEDASGPADDDGPPPRSVGEHSQDIDHLSASSSRTNQSG